MTEVRNNFLTMEGGGEAHPILRPVPHTDSGMHGGCVDGVILGRATAHNFITEREREMMTQ